MPGPTKKTAKKTASGNVRQLHATAGTSALNLDTLGGSVDPYPFVLGGQTYELSDLNDLPIDLIEAADTGDVQAIRNAIRYGLGDDGTPDAAELGKANWLMFSSNRLTIRQANALFVGWLEHSGLKQGE
jgi:hypothetical protein